MKNEFEIIPIPNKLTIDITGETYGRLTVLGLSTKKRGTKTCWVCQCKCGRKAIVRKDSLTSGHTSSCGCYNREQVSKRLSKQQTTHGESGTRLYKIWLGMRARCNNPNEPSYPRYGGRGIRVSDEWEESYIAFANWARSNGYQDNLTIDRIDNNGNYEKSNCRWATYREQAGNTSQSVMIEYNGEIHNIAEWSRITGINKNTLAKRHRRGDRDHHLFRPVRS